MNTRLRHNLFAQCEKSGALQLRHSWRLRHRDPAKVQPTRMLLVLVLAIGMVLEPRLGAFAETSWQEDNAQGLAELNKRNYEAAEKLILSATSKASTVDQKEQVHLLANLASVYKGQRKYLEAERTYKDAVDRARRGFGNEHEKTAELLNLLGNLYFEIARFAEAEVQYKEALSIRRKVLGNEHGETVISIGNLANLYLSLARHPEAEQLYKESLETNRKVFGNQHAGTANALANLSTLFTVTGRFAEAEKLSRESLTIRTQLFGIDHSNTFNSIDSLANILRRQGKYREAEQLLSDSIEVARKKFGEDNYDYNQLIESLAIVYSDQHRYAESETLLKRSTEHAKKTLGIDHPNTALSMSHLAHLYNLQGRIDDAESIYKQIYEVLVTTKGRNHPDTSAVLVNLATIMKRRKKLADAELAYKQAITNLKAFSDPNLAESMVCLARLYEEQNRYEESARLYTEAIEIHRKSLGDDHPVTRRAIDEYSDLLLKRRRPADAHAIKTVRLVPQVNQKYIFAFALSPNGKILATSDSSGVLLWDTASKLQFRSLPVQHAETMCFSPDGQTLFVGQFKGLTCWNVETGLLKSSLSDERIRWLQCSADGERLMSAGTQSIKLWEMSSKRLLFELPAMEDLLACKLSLDGSVVVCAWRAKEKGRVLYNKTILGAWDVNSGTARASVSVDRPLDESQFAVSPNGQAVALIGPDAKVMLWRTDRQEVFKTLVETGEKQTYALQYGSDGNKLAGYCETGDTMSMIIWDASTGKQLDRRSVKRKQAVVAPPLGGCPNISADLRFVVGIASDGRVEQCALRILDFYSKYYATSGWLTSITTLPATQSHKFNFAFCAEGKKLVFSCDKEIHVWRIGGDSCLYRLGIWMRDSNDLVSTAGGGIVAGSFVFSKEQNAASNSQTAQESKTKASEFEHRACIWDAQSEKLLAILDGEDDETYYGIPQKITSLAFNSDQTILYVGWNTGAISIWNVEDKVESGFYHENDFASVRALVVSKSGVLASAVRNRITLYGAEAEKLEGHKEPVSAIAFSPDGQTLASAAGKNIRLWDCKTGKTKIEIQETIVGSSSVTSLIFSEDGAKLISGAYDGSIKVWEVDSGQLRGTLSGHFDPIGKLELYPRNKNMLFSGSEDGLIKVWNLKTSAEICTISLKESGAWVVATPEGFFDAKPLDHVDSLAWVFSSMPTSALPLDLFMRQYYEPNLLGRLLSGGAPPSVSANTGARELSEINTIRPEVVIRSVEVSPDAPDLVDVTVSFRSVPGLGTSTMSASGVYDVRLFRNGRLVGYLPEGSSLAASDSPDLTDGNVGKGFTHKFKVRLPHRSGKHLFTAYGYNQDRVKSATRGAVFEPRTPLPQKKGRAYIVSFGANRFDDPGLRLRYAAEDARAFGSHFAQTLAATGKFEQVIFIPLVSDYNSKDSELPARKQTLEEVLNYLSGKPCLDSEVSKFLGGKGATKITPDDFVFLTFATHGDTDANTGEFYLFPTDTGKAQNTSDVRKRCVSSSELTDWVKDIDAADITMVIDTCHSGAVSGKDFRPGPMNARGLGQLAYYKKMRMIAASQASETAKEFSKLGHGLLTFALLNTGLQKDSRADTNPKDGKIQLGELLAYAVTEVPRLESGDYKNRSAEEAVAGERIVTKISETSNKQVSQTPSLFDFSDTDLVLLNMSQKSNAQPVLSEKSLKAKAFFFVCSEAFLLGYCGYFKLLLDPNAKVREVSTKQLNEMLEPFIKNNRQHIISASSPFAHKTFRDSKLQEELCLAYKRSFFDGVSEAKQFLKQGKPGEMLPEVTQSSLLDEARKYLLIEGKRLRLDDEEIRELSAEALKRMEENDNKTESVTNSR